MIPRHRPCPKPSAAVTLPVVHTVPRPVLLHFDQLRNTAVPRRQKPKSVPQRCDETTARTDTDGANRLADIRPGIRSRARVELMQRVGRNINPQESPTRLIPERPFTD